MKLSKAQQRAVDILRDNPDAFVVFTPTWDFQKIIIPKKEGEDFDRIKWFHKRTREVLHREGILVESHTFGRYILNDIKNGKF